MLRRAVFILFFWGAGSLSAGPSENAVKTLCDRWFGQLAGEHDRIAARLAPDVFSHPNYEIAAQSDSALGLKNRDWESVEDQVKRGYARPNPSFITEAEYREIESLGGRVITTNSIASAFLLDAQARPVLKLGPFVERPDFEHELDHLRYWNELRRRLPTSLAEDVRSRLALALIVTPLGMAVAESRAVGVQIRAEVAAQGRAEPPRNDLQGLNYSMLLQHNYPLARSLLTVHSSLESAVDPTHREFLHAQARQRMAELIEQTSRRRVELRALLEAHQLYPELQQTLAAPLQPTDLMTGISHVDVRAWMSELYSNVQGSPSGSAP